MGNVVVTVKTSGPVSGRKIMDAVKAIAGKDSYREKQVYRDGYLFIVGKHSGYPSGQVAILVDGKLEIDPEKEYQLVQVTSHGWSGFSYAVGEGFGNYVDAAKKFAELLERELSPQEGAQQ